MLIAYAIMILLIIGPTATYLIISNQVHRKTITAMYLFIKHKEVKFFVLSLIRFMINVGASVASISIVGLFIPQDAVKVTTLVAVWFLGIIISVIGYYGERHLKS